MEENVLWNQAALQAWRNDPFFAEDSVVLAVDIGIEGIGIAVRRGREWLFCKSLLVNLPEAKALANRRQYRAARHARKNRRKRMRRLKELFLKHDLPWVSDDILSRSDPFLLRHRAITGTLASKEALSICIRSCVERRGYDYYALSGKGAGSMPWGDSTNLKDAESWLKSNMVDATMCANLKALTAVLTKKNEEISPKECDAWCKLVDERHAKEKQEGIPAILAAYARKHLNERKARGFNFPREHVRRHLQEIIERHRHLIKDCDAFLQALFLPCTGENKERAIFYYNRKTAEESQSHFERKVKDCPYCEWLDLPRQKCGSNGDTDIMLWKLLDFVSNRTFDLEVKKGPSTRELLPEHAVKALVEGIRKGFSRGTQVESTLKKALAPLSTPTTERNEELLKQLRDICAPRATERSGRASMCAAAARAMVAAATADGTCFRPQAIEEWKAEAKFYEQRSLIQNYGGIYPQVQTLLGSLRKDHRTFATVGLLQRIFEKELKDVLGGKTVPDYVIIECVRDAAANKDQAAEITKENKKRRDSIDKLIEEFGGDPRRRGDRLRLQLFRQQGGSKTTPALCPFTGQELGTNPFDPQLQLAHLYPDSRGGLYMADNLVLTTAKINQEMGDRTPVEAAAAGLPGWLGIDEMSKLSAKFFWPQEKRALFVFSPKDGQTFPDFANMTRTSQLARELRNMAALWLGIERDAEAIRTRIGNPHGKHTAAARFTLLPDDYHKDRATHTHHRFDAAVMTCLPPTGLNDVHYKGCFTTVQVPSADRPGRTNRRLKFIEGLPVPDFEKLLRDGSYCPIIKLRSHSKYRSLGDSTFWSCAEDGTTGQRAPIPDKAEASDLVKSMKRMNLRHAPSEKEVERWLEKRQPATKDDKPTSKPLTLSNGTPVRSIHKFDSKGNLSASPLGWSGIITPTGKFAQLRKLSTSNDRLEIWLGWDSKKSCWKYYKRVIPTREALIGLKRMGLPWRGTENAPEYLIKLLKRKGAKDLKHLICSKLPPHAVKIGQIRKGDIFLLKFRIKKAFIKDGINTIDTWGELSAINASGQMEFNSITHKSTEVYTNSKAETFAKMLGEPPASQKAEELGLTPPV
ncbi:MAG: HNH endonuclease domain-containing protein [Akkermansia muciniphila]|nr:HNH endonuclease domain-containing protein [Akkermansia muciniphila]